VSKDKKLELRKCKICGKAFVGSADPFAKNFCPACLPKADRALEKVREYLRKNPRKTLNLQDLAEEIGELPRVVQALYEEESLVRGGRKKPSPPPEAPPKTSGKKRKRFSERYRKGDSKE